MSKDIANAFHEGMQVLFQTMFHTQETTDDREQLLFYTLNKDKSIVDDVYNETSCKVYGNPIPLAGKFTARQEEETNYLEGLSYISDITIPAKELTDHDLSVKNKEQWQVFYEGLFTISGVYYSVEKITPSVLIDGDYLFYKFSVKEVVDKSTIKFDLEGDTDEFQA